jgi:hypothetical protein
MAVELSCNGIDATELLIQKNGIDMAVIIADGMVNGLASDCPECCNSSLVTCHGRVWCWGYIEGVTKCIFKCNVDKVERFQWTCGPMIQNAHWFNPRGAADVLDKESVPQLKVPEIKSLRSLPSSGKKSELVKMLQEVLEMEEVAGTEVTPQSQFPGCTIEDIKTSTVKGESSVAPVVLKRAILEKAQVGSEVR